MERCVRLAMRRAERNGSMRSGCFNKALDFFNCSVQLAADRKLPLNNKSCAHPKLLLRDAGLGARAADDESIEFDASPKKNAEEAEEREGEIDGSANEQLKLLFNSCVFAQSLKCYRPTVPFSQLTPICPPKSLRSITLDTDFN